MAAPWKFLPCASCCEGITCLDACKNNIASEQYLVTLAGWDTVDPADPCEKHCTPAQCQAVDDNYILSVTANPCFYVYNHGFLCVAQPDCTLQSYDLQIEVDLVKVDASNWRIDGYVRFIYSMAPLRHYFWLYRKAYTAAMDCLNFSALDIPYLSNGLYGGDPFPPSPACVPPGAAPTFALTSL